MNRKFLWISIIALLVVCGAAVLTCCNSSCNSSDDNPVAVSPTVDLTLFDMGTEKELDMGGTFDWFGPESHPDFCGNPETGEYTGDNSKSPKGRSITEQQFKNRMILRRAMLAHGFKPLDSEWWHFTLRDEPFPDTYFTFPVRQLQ